MPRKNSNPEIFAIKVILGTVFIISFVAFGFSLASFNLNGGTSDKVDTFAISLTFVEIVLSVLAIILGLGGFIGFWMVRQAAIDSAATEARRYLDENAAGTFSATEKIRAGKISDSGGNSEQTQPDIPYGIDADNMIRDAEEIKDE